MPRDAWRLPLRRRDPVLRQVLESHAEDDPRAAAANGRRGARRAARAARHPWPRGDARIGALARQLGMSGRTLQRRLAAEGVSYQQLLDEARKEAAGRYILREQTLAICEVAYLVGLFGAGAVSSRVQALVRHDPGALPAETPASLRSASLTPQAGRAIEVGFP